MPEIEAGPEHDIDVPEAVGVFDSWATLQGAMYDLLIAGFSRFDISMLVNEDAVREKLGEALVCQDARGQTGRPAFGLRLGGGDRRARRRHCGRLPVPGLGDRHGSPADAGGLDRRGRAPGAVLGGFLARRVGVKHKDYYLEPAGRKAAPAAPVAPAGQPTSLAAAFRAAVEPLPGLDEPGFADAFDRFGSARVVLLGEASHGTSEFYRARAVITRRLIERHGFTIVAVEADWPDAAAIDRHVRQRPGEPMRSTPFTRFPTWMWRNRDVDDFVEFLRRDNAAKPPDDRAAFYGLDLYSMIASIAAVLGYLDRVDPRAAAEARVRYACLEPWSREFAAYGRASLSEGYALCEAPVTHILVDLLQNQLQYVSRDGEQFFDATQNARLVTNAERYYRVMYSGSHESWNLRDRPMFASGQL